MLFPKKTKFKKLQKSKIVGIETSVISPSFGFYGIKSLISGRITSQQIDSIRKLVSKKMHKFGKVIVRVFPYLPITFKPSETRMGKGKGLLNYWCFPIKPGRLIIEFQGISYDKALIINRLVNSKLCLRTKLIKSI